MKSKAPYPPVDNSKDPCRGCVLRYCLLFQCEEYYYMVGETVMRNICSRSHVP